MKKKLFLFLLLVITVISITSVDAQKCKFRIDKKDPLTGNLHRLTNIGIVPLSPMNLYYWYMGFERLGDTYHIKNLIDLPLEFQTYLNKGDSIVFKFADGSIITCHAKEQVSPVRKVDTYNKTYPIRTSYTCDYENLTKENLTTFSTSLLVFVRMNISDKVYEKEIKEKIAKRIMRDAICIQKD